MLIYVYHMEGLWNTLFISQWWWCSCWAVSDSWDPKHCSLTDGSVHGISQARILEWVAISFSRGIFWPRDWTCVSCTIGRFFTTKPPEKPSFLCTFMQIWLTGFLFLFFNIGLFSCIGSWLQHMGSLDQGLNPGPLHWEHGILATGPPGEPPDLLFKIYRL